MTAYPLAWPLGWKRTAAPRRARFSGRETISTAARFVLQELERLGARDAVIASNVELRLDGLPRSNQRTPGDRGVAVYFRLKGRDAVLACDAWDLPEHNLRAIGKHVEAIRGQARWGVGSIEQAFTGYQALPPARNGARPWWEVLELDGDVQRPEVVRERYRALARERHPDTTGGSSAAFVELRRAYDDACRTLGVDP